MYGTSILLAGGIAANTIFLLNGEKQPVTDTQSIREYSYSWERTDSNIITEDMLRNFKRLDSFAELPDNWNGYGAGRISEKLIEKTKRIIFGLSVQPMLFPTGRKSIQFEYEKPDGEYLEFEVFEDRITLLHISGDEETEKDIDEETVFGEVVRFHAFV